MVALTGSAFLPLFYFSESRIRMDKTVKKIFVKFFGDKPEKKGWPRPVHD
jgi:hypothetical protein